MSKEQSNIVEYLVCVIGAFAKQFSLTNAKAYQYLRQYKGLDFLTKHYDIEHTQSIEDAVEDITIVCNRHGGHGSNVSIETIDLKRGRKGKDFGQGFYLSADRNQAQMMAERTVDREESGKATLTTFEFDEDILKNHTTMKVKVFEGYSKEWAEFIMMNRRNKTDKQAHDYDIVYGPIADDKVGLTNCNISKWTS